MAINSVGVYMFQNDSFGETETMGNGKESSKAVFNIGKSLSVIRIFQLHILIWV